MNKSDASLKQNFEPTDIELYREDYTEYSWEYLLNSLGIFKNREDVDGVIVTTTGVTIKNRQ